MKVLLVSLAIACATLGAFAAEGPSAVTVDRKSEQKIATGPEKNFTGRAQIAGLFARPEPSRLTGAIVTFDPGARTAWHTHPAGQTLVVTRGMGLVQQWGGPRQEIREGDVVWIPPGVKHWHGGSPAQEMSHVAIMEKQGGTNVEWMEKVTDAQYRGEQ
jgi:quercetin dioxygenase-like cupin family protein